MSSEPGSSQTPDQRPTTSIANVSLFASELSRPMRHRRSDARRRRIVQDVLDITTYDQEEEASFYEEFLKKTWHTFIVSPLYKFDYSRNSLRQYASRLSAYVESEFSGMAVAVGQSINAKANFSVLTGIPNTPADDKAIKIKVFALENQAWKQVLLALLCGVHTNDRQGWPPNIRHQFVILPLMLAKGRATYMKMLAEFLKEQFDCGICQLTLPSIELCWMASMWASFSGDSRSSFKFLYKTGREDLDTIVYSLDVETVNLIWRRIHSTESDIVKHEEMEAFMEAVETHMRNTLGINLRQFFLYEIHTPAALVDASGRVKVLNAASSSNVLRHLTSLSQELMFMHRIEDS